MIVLPWNSNGSVTVVSLRNTGIVASNCFNWDSVKYPDEAILTVTANGKEATDKESHRDQEERVRDQGVDSEEPDEHGIVGREVAAESSVFMLDGGRWLHAKSSSRDCALNHRSLS